MTESDGTIEDGNAPWSGTFSVGGTGEERLAPGSYTVYFACGYIPTSPPSGGLPATDGSPTAYGDYTAKAFEICADGTQTCSSSTTATSTTTTTVNTTTAPTTTSTSAAPASTTTTTTVATTNVASTRPGGIVDVTAIGFKPNSTGTVDFESAPVRVATFAANSNGDVSVAVRIPSRAAAGLHHIVLTGVDPNGAPRTLRVAINVAGIVRTGASSTLLLAIAAALVVIGVVVRTATGDRRPRAAHLRSR
ncbi:MAG TPA: hypothetical protein VMZ22_10100 [Acidimicrobiales bacterium]|nr:hypothetical protein [Acidimicrobiales bacterium]